MSQTKQKPVSASQLKLWKLCKRKRQFVYAQGLREKPNAAAQAGTKVHVLLEQWVKENEKPPAELLWDNYDLGRMAWALGYKLPDRSQLRVSEESFTLDLYGVSFTGIIDLQTDTDIIDFKTTSKLKYVKSNEELETDEQRLLYVAARPDLVRTSWLYGVWEDYSVHPRTLDVDVLPDREKFKLHVLQPAEELLKVASDVDPLSLPAPEDTSVCKLYPPLGCPFKSKCFPPNKTAAKMTKLLDRLKTEPREETKIMPLEIAHKEDLINGPGRDKKEVPPEPAPQPAEAPSLDERSIEYLFIDCFPVGGWDLEIVTPASSLIAHAAGQVAADNHVPHALLIDYGKGGPMVAAQLADDLKGKSYQYVYLETKSAEGKAVLQVMMGAARYVVKGMI